MIPVSVPSPFPPAIRTPQKRSGEGTNKANVSGSMRSVSEWLYSPNEMRQGA
jgi:hypothetical protein